MWVYNNLTGVDEWQDEGQDAPFSLPIDPTTGQVTPGTNELPQFQFDPSTGSWKPGDERPLDSGDPQTNLNPNPGPNKTGGGWFDSNQPPNNFGAPTAPFGETYTTLPRPGWLGQYSAPTWQGGDFQAPAKWKTLIDEFKPPSAEDVMNSPAVQARLAAAQKGFERSAAAKGSILSGGSVNALGREQQNLASTEYGNEFDRRLKSRQQNYGEYTTDYGNAFDTYKQRYGQFLDSANLGAQARGINEGAYQFDVGAGQQQYATRYGAFVDQANRQRQADVDWWAREQDRIKIGLPQQPPG